MALLPIRHPQKDFFILDIADVVPKDDTASMEHPIFSLATKPDMRHLDYQTEKTRLKITPSFHGLPTIFDKDILIFCISQLMQLRNQGKPTGARVKFSAREMMIATNRRTGGVEYQRLEAAFQRLIGTTFQTNIKTGGKIETRVFNLVSEAGFVRHEESWRVDHCEVVLSDWIMRAIEAADVVTISPDYFRLRRPLERRLYEIARKHCGEQSRWHVGLEKLQAKTGSNAPLKRFRHNLKEIIEGDHTPFYQFELSDSDLVIVRPRQTKRRIANDLVLPSWAEDQARAIARDKGYDYHGLLHEWQEFARAGNPPDNAGAAFIGFCKQKKAWR